MESTVRATCPKCQTALRIPAEWLGQAVKCKKCGAMVRTKARPPAEAPSPDDTAPNPALPQAVPVPASQAPAANAFDFSQPSDEDDGFFGLPHAAAPAPAPPLPDATGYPPPGYPYPALPPGYPAPPPGYPAPPGYGPPPGYPYAPPPGYPYPMPPGYGPPPGYPYPAPPPGYPAGYALPAGYAPPPGYPYPQAAPAPAPAAPAPQPAAAQPPAPTPAKPAVPTKPGAPKPAKLPLAQPVAPSNEFKMDPAAVGAIGASTAARGRYQRDSGKSKFVWIGVCLLMTAGLVAGGIYGVKFMSKEAAPKDAPKPDPDGAGAGPKAPPAAVVAPPRRVLFISVTKYMYLNPLTAGPPGSPDRVRAAANGLAFQWHIPYSDANKEKNQVFVLSDTITSGPDERLPLKNVVQGAYGKFFETSRRQDRVLIYFGGHALEKDGKAYLASMEADPDGEDGAKTLIPLDHFYEELKKCPAAQKVVIWDVCRYNPEKGKVRPGSEAMTEGLYKALTSPPPGVQVVTTCKAGETALELTQFRPEGSNTAPYSGSVFLESLKFVAAPSNKRLTATTPAAADPLPIADWHPAIAKRAAEMCDLAEKVGSGGKQTVTLTGAAPDKDKMTAPNPGEAVAARFAMPDPPKGASPVEVRALAQEFTLPPLKPDLAALGLADFPFPADALKDYAADAPFAESSKDDKKYPFRVAVVGTLEALRKKWEPGAGTTNIRNAVLAPIDDKFKGEVKKEQGFWADSIAQLELELDKMNALKADRDSEPSKRWQAHYDFALASLKARLAYMNEYNKLLGNLVIESLPELKKDLGQDGYTLVASDVLKSGKEVKKMADEAQALFAEIAVRYKGTPWAIQAKQEKSVAIGLAWKPASLAKEKPLP